MFTIPEGAAELAQDMLFIWGFQFFVMTLIAYLAKGKDAFKWSYTLVRSARVNWGFIAFNVSITPILIATTLFIHYLINLWSVPHLSPTLWQDIPFALQIIGSLILLDFIEYWEHRIKHHRILWPLHGVHHSDTEMNYLTSHRLHPFDTFTHHILLILMGSLIGLEAPAIALLISTRILHQQYVHMNIDWHHGKLEWLVASPRYHRWHHADTPEAWDKNFALIMPLWDMLFGTYYCPGKCETETGFENNPGDNFLHLLIYPFAEWVKMIGRGLGILSKPVPSEFVDQAE